MNRKATGLIFIERRPGYMATTQGGLKGQLKNTQEIQKKSNSSGWNFLHFLFNNKELHAMGHDPRFLRDGED